MQILICNSLFFLVNSVAPKRAVKILRDSLFTKDCVILKENIQNNPNFEHTIT